MRFHKLFTVPEGQKVTEKYLRRVLVSSICSILLCMTCLVSTTWAWFTVSIKNTDNVIHVAKEPPEVAVTVNGNSIDSNVPNLPAGTHSLDIVHTSAPDDVQQKSTLYVTFSVDNVVKGYVILNEHNDYQTDLRIEVAQDCFLSWTVSWFVPDGADPIGDDMIDEGSEETTDPTEDTTAPTESETEPEDETTAPTEVTQPTEGETEPPQETTAPAEDETEPPQETTAPTEGETEPPEETTQPAQTPPQETTVPAGAESSGTEDEQ